MLLRSTSSWLPSTVHSRFGSNDYWKRLTVRYCEGSPFVSVLPYSRFDSGKKGRSYDRSLNRVETVLAAIDYIHRNRERRDLVDRALDREWSSARWYEGLPYNSNYWLPKLERPPAEFLA